jgi:hypothetical protein
VNDRFGSIAPFARRRQIGCFTSSSGPILTKRGAEMGDDLNLKGYFDDDDDPA